jgi:hypothetical protein
MRKAITSSNHVTWRCKFECLIEIEAHVKCTKQHAPTAVKNAKCRSNQTLADQYTAANAGQKEDQPEDPATKPVKKTQSSR